MSFNKIQLLLFIFFISGIVNANKITTHQDWLELSKQYQDIDDSLFYHYTQNALKSISEDHNEYLSVSLLTARSAAKVSLLDTAEFILDRINDRIYMSTDSLLLAQYYYVRSFISQKRGKLVRAENEILRSIEFAKEKSNLELARAYNLYASILFRKGKQEASLNTLFKVEDIYAIDSSIVIEYANSNNNIGNIYQEIGNYEKALTYHRKASLINQKLQKNANLLISYNNIAVSHLKMKESDSALYYLRLIIDNPNNHAFSHINSKAYLNIGVIYLDRKDFKTAIANLNQSKLINENNDDKVGCIIALFNMGEVYIQSNQLQKGKEVLEKALQLTKEIGVNRYYSEVYGRLVRLSVKNKNYKEALTYQQAYSNFKDSLYDKVEIKVLENIEVKYNQERQLFRDSLDRVRENNIIALAQEKRIQQLESEQNIRNLLSICLLFIAGLLFLIYSKYRAQKRSNAIIDATNEELKRTLISKEEKEVLLKEIHHRVKNNLQIISSLMRLQSNTSKSFQLKANYQEMQGRINSMALVHQQLYGSKDFTLIDVAEYINTLVDRVQNVYSSEGIHVVKHIEIKDLTIEELIPLGLLINELLTNCFKYAFKEDIGEIEINVKYIDERRYLSIEDNGVGLEDPEKEFDKGTFGAELFKTLVEQLDGSYELSSEGGLKVEVYF
jgi:two-component sensor histidine kinase